MRRKITIVAAAALQISAAAAHPGDHSALAGRSLLAHLAEPFHLALLGLGVAATGLCWMLARRQRSQSSGQTVRRYRKP